MNFNFLIGPLIGALIALAAYLHKNRIGYEVITIASPVKGDDPQITLNSPWGTIHSERLVLKNYGIRELEDVELHLTVSTEPVSISVADPTTLSKSAVQAEWRDCLLKVSLPHFPSGEQVQVDFLRIGNYEIPSKRLRSTGGKYMVVGIERHKAQRQMVFLLGIAAFSMLAPIVGSWIDEKIASSTNGEVTVLK